MKERTVVGIDLGTTNSCLALVDAMGKPEVLPNSQGDYTTPSVIYFEPGGKPLVGKPAKDMRASDHMRVVEFVKREMGNKNYIFLAEPDDDEDDAYSPEDLSALILRKLKKDAEEYLGKEITDAVITVPAYFRDAQREATIRAGKFAGLNVLEIIDEPTAAALAYGLGRGAEKERILVYDLGGGTFDVSILEIEGGEYRVVTSDGDSLLGGKDFDDRIINFFIQAFKTQHGIDLAREDDIQGELRDKAERAKIKLSDMKAVRERITFSGRTAEIELTRERLEALTEDLMGRTEDLVLYTLSQAKLSWADIDHLLLVGGSTRMPMVGNLLKRISGKSPSKQINPDQAVAMGAALKGWFATGELGPADSSDHGFNTLGGGLPPPPDKRIIPAASHSMGVITVDRQGKEINTIVIKKSTPLPANEWRVFPAAEDNITSVVVKITQGEDSDPAYCSVVGEFVLGPIPPRPRAESRIRVSFSYDKNGSVKVSAVDETSGKSIVEEVSSSDVEFSGSDLEKKRKRLEDLLQDD